MFKRSLILPILLAVVFCGFGYAQAGEVTIVIKDGETYLVGPDGQMIKLEDGGDGGSLGEGLPEDAPEADWSKLEDFEKVRKGIKEHQDWINYYKDSKDYRVFFLLASRAGRVIDVPKSKRISEALLQEPEHTDKVLKDWGIDRDVEKYNAEEVEKWKKLFKEDALIFETKNYIILGTEKDEDFLKYLKYYQQKVFKFYEKKFKAKEKAEPFLIKIYPSRQAYVNAGAPVWSGAYYSGHERAMVGFVPEDRNMTWVAQTLIKTFFHEGWHQYMHHHVPNPPIWLDEGLAQIHETTVVQGSRIREGKKGAMHVTFDMVQNVHARIKAKQYIPIKKMLYMTIREFQQIPDISYPQVYSFQHFLIHGPKKYRKIPEIVIEELMNGKGRVEALDVALKGFDLEEMEEEWLEHALEEMEPINTPSYFKN